MNVNDKPSRRQPGRARARLSALVGIMLSALILAPPAALAPPPPRSNRTA